MNRINKATTLLGYKGKIWVTMINAHVIVKIKRRAIDYELGHDFMRRIFKNPFSGKMVRDSVQ